MIHQEKDTGRKSALLLILFLFFLLILPRLLIPEWGELRRFEAFRALEVQELSTFPGVLSVFGKPASGGNCFPLYPLLAKGLTKCSVSTEYAIRAVPVLCLAGLVLMVFFCCSTVSGTTAGAAGAVITFTTLLAANKMYEATPVFLQTLGIFAGWLIWFYFGIWRNSWKLAWITTGLVAGLVFYASGPWGVMLMIVPPLFLRRPLSVWTKPRGTAFAAGIVCMAFFVLLWGMPRWHAGIIGAFHDSYTGEADLLSYILQLLTLPFKTLLQLLPWSILIWAPFCAALIPLNTAPMLSKYVRWLFAGVFVLLWLSPATHNRDLVVLIPPAAVLIGLDYGLLARRYGERLLFLARCASLVLMILSAGLFACRFIPGLEKTFPFLPPSVFSGTQGTFERIAGLSFLIISFGFAFIILLFARKKARVYLVFAFVFLSLHYLKAGAEIPDLKNTARTRGNALCASLKKDAGKLPADLTVYKSSLLPDYYAEIFYAGFRVISFTDEDSLPAEQGKIYMLSGDIPSVSGRSWKKITKNNNTGWNLAVWEGLLRMDDDNEQ